MRATWISDSRNMILRVNPCGRRHIPLSAFSCSGGEVAMGLVTAVSSVIGLSYMHMVEKHRGTGAHRQLISSNLYSRFISPLDGAFSLPQARIRVLPSVSSITCSAANKPSSSSGISSTAKIRSEVLSPFRTVRMFFYLAFIASGSLGGLIAVSQLIGALTNASRAAQVPNIAGGLGIDVAAITLFSFLYSIDNNAKNTQLARLSREENLSNLQLRVGEKRVIPVSSLRGIGRLVIVAGPSSFISESFKLSQPYTERLVERGILAVPFATDGSNPEFEFDESEEESINSKRKRLWQLSPVYPAEWSEWLDEQKKIAKVPPESPVYLSLRLDGRVRGSGVGYPPWNAFVVQIPPMTGMWSGLLDGMDGRVL